MHMHTHGFDPIKKRNPHGNAGHAHAYTRILGRFLGAQEAPGAWHHRGVGGRGVGPTLYFPYGSTIDFEEIVKIIFFE